MNEISKEKIEIFALELGLDKILASLLLNRGIDTLDKARDFLCPSPDKLTSPFLLSGMEGAIRLIKNYIDKGKKIVIYGDYDCDGIGAAAILYLTLKDMGASVSAFIPVRGDEGYGLSIEGIDKVIQSDTPSLIITVDCGISSAKEIEYAKEKGIEVIVTDHHEPQEGMIPDCIIINPKMEKDYPMLCGAGVALKLVEGLKGRDYAMEYMDICAISTIADMVPLVGDNRIIASLGLQRLSKNTRTGLKALLKVSGHKFPVKLTSYDVAYKIAPRLNASGRLSTAEKSLRILIEDDPFIVHMLAEELELENKERQDICQKTIEEARELLKDYDLFNNKVIVMAKDDWEGGVIGIAAAKISQEFQRPTILFTCKEEVLKGSCRSINGVNIYDVLYHCKDLLMQFGGHSMAAGLSIDKQNLEDFIQKANEYVSKNFDKSLFLPYIRHDATLELKNIDLDFASGLSRFEPFGMDNPKPLFVSEVGGVPFERISIHNHIKCNLKRDVSIIGFNYLDYLNILTGEGKKKIYYSVEREIFRNTVGVKCYLKGVEVDEIFPSEEELTLSYLDKFIKREAKEGKKGKKLTVNEEYGHLLMAFSMETYDMLSKKYPTYRRQYGILDTANPHNTILLAPYGRCESFDYFGLIEIYDSPPVEYVIYLRDSFRADILIHQNKTPLNISPITVQEMRETFVYIKKYFNGKRGINIFRQIKKKGYTYSEQTFYISFFIFLELGLIAFQKDNIIFINDEKVDLHHSNIYKLMVNYASNS